MEDHQGAVRRLVESATGADTVRLALLADLDGPVELGTATVSDRSWSTVTGVRVHALIADDVRDLVSDTLAAAWDALRSGAGDREPLLVLRLSAPPPVEVEGRGALPLSEAVNDTRTDHVSIFTVDRHTCWVLAPLTWARVR